MTEAESVCQQVDDNMSDIIDGVAPAALFDHVAGCERCRDARFETEQVLLRVGSTSDDYRFPEELEARLMAALDAREAAPAPPPNGRGVSETEPTALVKLEESRASQRAIALSPPSSSSRRIEPARPARSPEGPSTRWAWLSLAAAVMLGIVWLGNREETARVGATGVVAGAWYGEVVQVQRAFGSETGLVSCERGKSECHPALVGEMIRGGARLETDGLTRALLKLADGSVVALDRATRLELDPREQRRARLLEGNLVAEIERQPDPAAGGPAGAEATPGLAVFDVPAGRAEVLGTKLALRASSQGARVEVSRGVVRLVDAEGRGVSVQAGEAGEIAATHAPRAETVLDLGQAFGWSSSAFDESEAPEAAQGALGELTAKRPSDTDEQSGAVRLVEHHIRTRIVDNIARTEVEEVFTNQTDDVLEGIYRFPLPPGAQIERLALEVDGKLEEGAFVDRERAAAIWRGAVVNAGGKKPPPVEEIIWVPGPWKDPALLEWQRGNRFELRIFPIPRRGSRRIILAYTQVLPPAEGGRQYIYPLPQDPRGTTRIDRFTAEIQVRGHHRERGVKAHGYALNTLSGSPDVARLAFEAQDFVPHGDLGIVYELESAEAQLRAWAYQPDSAADAPYVALALRPTLPRRAEHEARDYVLVADTSRSMIGESYRRTIRVIERVIREMDRRDRVTVLACDSVCESLGGGFQAPGERTAHAAAQFLGDIEPEGASDLTFAIQQAAALGHAEDRRSLRILYVGDGTPTVGPIHPALIKRAVGRALPRSASLNAVAIGSDADQAALRVATHAGGGVTLAFTPGQSVEDVAYAALGATYGHALRNARLTLPEGMVAVLPSELGSIAAGSEEVIVARLSRPRVEGTAVLRGEVAGEDFEQRYPLEVVARTGQANAFVPRLYAAVAIESLSGSMDESARRRSIELSTQFNVASRYTSLLVLESPAMFKAFGLDNSRKVAEWSGDQESDKSETESEVVADGYGVAADGKGSLDSAPWSSLGSTPGGSAGSGRGAPAKAKERSMSLDEEGYAWAPGAEKKAAPAQARAPLSQRARAPASAAMESSSSGWDDANLLPEPEPRRREQPLELAPPPPQRMIPMRRVWDRVGAIHAPPALLELASPSRRATLEARVHDQEQSREALKGLYVVDFLAGDLERARDAAERWSLKDPLDVDALTARADLAAQRGQRDLAIRILGSVVDVRPGDHKAQWRLARLHRWAGRAERGCRHSLAVAQLMLGDAKLVAEAVSCSKDVGQDTWHADLLTAVSPEVRQEVRRLTSARLPVEELSGDFRLRARWQGAEHDLDLVILHPDGYRVSWLGAPTRSVITATDVLSVHQEGLALRGAAPGQYAVEVVRSSPTHGTVRGSLDIRVGHQDRSIPFELDGERVRVATAKLKLQSRLVPY